MVQYIWLWPYWFCWWWSENSRTNYYKWRPTVYVYENKLTCTSFGVLCNPSSITHGWSRSDTLQPSPWRVIYNQPWDFDDVCIQPYNNWKIVSCRHHANWYTSVVHYILFFALCVPLSLFYPNKCWSFGNLIKGEAFLTIGYTTFGNKSYSYIHSQISFHRKHEIIEQSGI
jgi:hypothetical protein